MLDVPRVCSLAGLHRDCDQDLERNDYWVSVERANTLARLIDWSAHLSGKVWCHETNWDDLQRIVAEAAGGADA